jgi:hypothetical protein
MEQDSSAGAPAPSPASQEWAAWSDEQLLDLRMSDLGVQIDGTWLQDCVVQLYAELEARGISFRPHFWLSDEWFTPDGVTGVAIPFYLAHPRLARLEDSQMLEVEGGTPEWCMKILRHEAGHALDNAYEFRRLGKRIRLFGRPNTPYPEFYTPRPYSRSFVLHLESWYAQAHPDEDFAETFAVWLTPDVDWRARYAGWPALRKLEYMDALMRQTAGQPPRVTSRRRVEPLTRIRRTLRQHYGRKREYYGVTHPENFYDRDLLRLFTNAPGIKGASAARFLARIRKDVRRSVARWTGEYQYTIDRVLEDMIDRCRALNLRLTAPEDQARLDFTIVLTVQTLNYLHSGRHQVAL